MAKRVIEVLTSDLSGDDLGDDGQTIEFSYQGVDYSIDLTKKEANNFDKSLTTYTKNARRVGGRKKKTPSPSSTPTGKEKSQLVREWARQNGHTVSDRGRINQQVQDAYDAAH
jgi:hypothetical protein